TAASEQTATWQELEAEQRTNETAAHRVVGLVIETRPNTITPQALLQLRRMGCTKIQVGIQTLDPAINAANDRPLTPQQAQRCFELLRLFGFKIHSHFMLNLLGATPESDLADYRAFMTLPAFQPDEVKLYPCALIGGTRLERAYEAGEWRPYSEQELVDTIAADVRVTPPWCRLSRIIRDFSACDIVAGNKQGNLRQEVERRLRDEAAAVQEIRFREISMEQVDPAQLELQVIPYETTATSERFLQWVTPDNRIVGFLRLSIPHADAMSALLRGLEAPTLPLSRDSPMIREVHVYGRATALGDSQEGGAQHQGLGRRLIAAACDIAREQGTTHVNVISSVGTREYYRALGFRDAGLYQTLTL
ncbi:MAG: GNAT family N-acetyltransferase, partial [Coriobacteriales bacterium]|nr:GNAT family N-acetyltransferase [Coriobacteriales bacterium]